MRKHYNFEKINGEIAVRSMSKKAQDYYNQTDPLTVWEYEKCNKTVYSINDCGYIQEDLSFKELEKYMEAYYD